MITKSSLTFLQDLKQNNNRQWFQDNKYRYEAARAEFLSYISLLLAEMSRDDPEMALINPRETLFRIHRDVRFSKDKSPYKTQMGAYIVKGGKNSGNAGFYFHLEPGGSFAGGGVWQPSADRLKLLREEIYENIREFKSIIEDPFFKKKFPGIYGEKLKKPPRGFPADFPDIDLLKYKSYTVICNFSDDNILEQGSAGRVAEIFRLMASFNDFINHSFVK